MRGLGVGCVVILCCLLSGCIWFAPKTSFDDVEKTAQTRLAPLSDTDSFVQEALSSPAAQAVIQKLNQKGWIRKEGTERVFVFERGKILTIMFDRAVDEQDPLPPVPPKPVPPKASGGMKGGTASSQPPSFFVYVALPEKEEVFAVVEESSNSLLHLYPDNERRFLLLNESVLDQLRKNERFVKFESWLKQQVDQVGCGPVLIDEVTNIAYIFINGLSSTLSTSSSISPAVYPPPSSYTKDKTFLALAKVTAKTTQSVTIDPATIWIVPSGVLAENNYNLNGAENNYGLKIGVNDVYEVIAGGRQPTVWADLRSFGYPRKVETMPPPELMSLPPRDPGKLPPPGEDIYTWGLTVFLWELADYSQDNLLLEFVPKAELTLASYNAAFASGSVAYGVVRTVNSEKKVPVYLAGFSQLTLKEVEKYHDQVLQILRQAESPYLEVPLEAVAALLEERLGFSLMRLGELLLQLARAEKEGRFNEVYAALLPQGLDRLVGLFPRWLPDWRVPVYIKALALAYAQRVAATELAPQGIYEWIRELMKAILVNLMIKVLTESREGYEQPRFVKGLVDLWVVQIEKKDANQLRTLWDLVEPWLRDQVDEHVGEHGPPPDYDQFHRPSRAAWQTLISHWRAQFGKPPEIAAPPEVTAPIVGLVYTFKEKQLQFAMHEAAADEFRPMFYLLLKMLHYVLEASVQEYLYPGGQKHPGRKHGDTEDRWLLAGVIIDPTQAALVMYKHDLINEEGSFFYGNFYRDIAVVNFYDKPLPAVNETNPDEHEIVRWVDAAVKLFESDDWYFQARPPVPRWGGFDIAAVVFPRKLSADEITNVRNLAKTLANKYQEDVFDPDLKDHFGRAIFIVWMEDEEIWYACIERGPGELSEEKEQEIAKAVMVGDFPNRPIKKFNPHENSPQQPSKKSNPHASGALTLVGGALCLDSRNIYHPISLPLGSSP